MFKPTVLDLGCVLFTGDFVKGDGWLFTSNSAGESPWAPESSSFSTPIIFPESWKPANCQFHPNCLLFPAAKHLILSLIGGEVQPRPKNSLLSCSPWIQVQLFGLWPWPGRGLARFRTCVRGELATDKLEIDGDCLRRFWAAKCDQCGNCFAALRHRTFPRA